MSTGRWVLTVGLIGAAAYAAVRPRLLRWGASAREVGRSLPGDDVVPRPQYSATNAVEIRADPAEVWPWLVQMGGYTRGGWYSYDRLDNAGRPSADRIVPEWQHLDVGDMLPTAPDGTGYRVERIDPQRCLVLAIRGADWTVGTALVLERTGVRRTRLINRTRFRIRPTPRTVAWALLMDAGHIVMTRKMLAGIRERAERLAAAFPDARKPEDRLPGRPLRYDLAVVVRRPPSEVEAYLADIDRFAPEPGSSPVLVLERTTAGPTRVGTAWREVVRLGPGLRMTVRSTVTYREPGSLLAMDFRSRWFTGALTYTVESVPGGALLRHRETLRLRAPWGPLPRLVDRGLRPRLLERLGSIRDELESGAAVVGTATGVRTAGP